MRFFRSIAYIVITALVSVSFFSCKDDDDNKIISGERTIICYMPAENSLASRLRDDINEMIKCAHRLGEKDRIVIYYDGISNPQIFVIDRNTNALSVNSFMPVFTYNTDGNSCSKEVMMDAFKYIIRHYPAKSYGLIFNSHGLGWLPPTQDMLTYSKRRKSFGIDNGLNEQSNSVGKEMRIVDLAEAIKSLPHLDFILFDLCYMQNIEIAYQLRNCADYIIGSPAEIPADGAPYDLIMPMLISKDVDYKSVVDTYGKTYDGWEQIPESGVVLSVMRCNQLDSLRIVTNKMTSKYGDELKKCRYNGTTDYLSYKFRNGYQAGFFDMKEMIYRMIMEANTVEHGFDEEEKIADYAEWNSVFNKAVPYSYVASKIYSTILGSSFITTDKEHCGGISMSLNPNETTIDVVIDEYESLEWRYSGNEDTHITYE